MSVKAVFTLFVIVVLVASGFADNCSTTRHLRRHGGQLLRSEGHIPAYEKSYSLEIRCPSVWQLTVKACDEDVVPDIRVSSDLRHVYINRRGAFTTTATYKLFFSCGY